MCAHSLDCRRETFLGHFKERNKRQLRDGPDLGPSTYCRFYPEFAPCGKGSRVGLTCEQTNGDFNADLILDHQHTVSVVQNSHLTGKAGKLVTPSQTVWGLYITAKV